MEAQVAARRDGFYERLVRDVLERTDIVLQQLDRRIEGERARHGEDVRALQAELAELRAAIDRLRAASPAAAGG